MNMCFSSTHTLGEPPFDLWEFDIARFSPFSSNKEYLKHRAREALTRLYSIPYPCWEMESGRGIKKSPLYSSMDSLGASWGCVNGWESANWFCKKSGELKP